MNNSKPNSGQDESQSHNKESRLEEDNPFISGESPQNDVDPLDNDITQATSELSNDVLDDFTQLSKNTTTATSYPKSTDTANLQPIDENNDAPSQSENPNEQKTIIDSSDSTNTVKPEDDQEKSSLKFDTAADDNTDSLENQADTATTSASHPDSRRTVLTFGVPEEDSSKQHDTAILSENNSGLRRAISSQSNSTMPDGTATLGENREVILVIRGMIERLVLNSDIKYKLGRFELGTKGLDEIDLTPYGALDRGVSRLHAELLLKEGRLYILDLDSSNGTYIAGQRLKPSELTLLRKGDELMLGRLPIQVLFR